MGIEELESFEDFISRKKDVRMKEKKLYHISRKGNWYPTIKDIIYIPQHDDNDKILTFEVLDFDKSDGESQLSTPKIQYRLGYYMRSKKDPNSRIYNKWIWGQFTPIIPVVDFNKLMLLVKEKGYLTL